MKKQTRQTLKHSLCPCETPLREGRKRRILGGSQSQSLGRSIRGETHHWERSTARLGARGGPHFSSRGSVTSHALALQGGSKLKWISQGCTLLPILISILILLELENLNFPLALINHRILALLCLILGNQHPTQVILEALFRLLEGAPLRPQGSLCRLNPPNRLSSSC